MKNRSELAKYFAELGFKVGAEVGVYRGDYSAELCANNPELKLYCIDSWGTPLPGKGEGVDKKNAFRKAQKLLAPYNCELIKKFSMDAVKDFEDNSLDFVYIDADHHYPLVRNDIREWAKKVHKGGIVSGHDYITSRMLNSDLGVMRAVDEYVAKHGCKLELTGFGQSGNDHESPASLRSGYLLPSLRREKNPSRRPHSLWRRETEAKYSSLSSTGLRPWFFAKGDKDYAPSWWFMKLH